MKSLSKSLYWKNLAITVVILALLISLAFLTHRYKGEIDLTANSRNTLSEASFKLLETLDAPVEVIAYIRPALPIRPQITQLIARYQAYKKDISLKFIDPNTDLENTKVLSVGAQGLITVTYKGRTEKIKFLDESSFTNALLQLSHSSQRWVSFLTGHGERSPQGEANFDLSFFAKELARRNIKAQTLNLTQIDTIPDNTALLVLASPRVALLEGEISIIQNYIKQGGNLLLLSDPEDAHLSIIEQQLGIEKLAGTVVNKTSQLYKLDDPSFVLIGDYNRHPVTKGMQSITMYPMTAALKVIKKTEFNTEPILKTVEQAWTETSDIKGKIEFNKDTEEVSGSLTIGMALRRNLDKGTEQRIAVIGDGDFLSNTFLGNVGNLEMGLRLFNWLIHDDQFIEIPVKVANDSKLQLSSVAIAVIGLGFLLVIPAGLIAIGFFIWYRRKRR